MARDCSRRIGSNSGCRGGIGFSRNAPSSITTSSAPYPANVPVSKVLPASCASANLSRRLWSSAPIDCLQSCPDAPNSHWLTLPIFIVDLFSFDAIPDNERQHDQFPVQLLANFHERHGRSDQ